MEQSAATDRRWWVLAGACAGLTVLMLDSTVINLALPALHRDLDASTSQLQWFVNGYLIVIAALVLTAGRLGDIFGRRRVFLAGLVAFGVGAVIGALAQNPVEMLVARGVQGVGAALLLPLSLTMVNDAFPPDDRARAMGIWAAVSSIALAIGPVIGGTLASLDWRLIFWIDVPIVVFGFLVTRWAAVESRDETATGRVDFPGVALLTAGLVMFTLGIAQASTWGWASATTLVVAGCGLLLLVAFWLVEHRVADPIVDFELFRNKPYLGVSAAAFTSVAAYWLVMFFQPQYLQDIRGYTATEAGLLILPVTVPLVLMSPFVHRLTGTIGYRIVMGTGMTIGTVGLLVMSRIGVDTSYAVLLVGFLLFGISLGFVYAPMQAAALAAMPQAKAGIASGMLAMNRIFAGAVALAVCSSVFSTLLTNQIQEEVEVTPKLSEHDATELQGLAAGTATAQKQLAEQPPQLADAITGAVDSAYAYAISHVFWIPVALSALGAVAAWTYIASPRGRPEVRPPEHPAHRFRFHL